MRKLIIPIAVDHIMQAAVGITDSIIVASVGEAAVLAVSLVDMIITLIIFTSTAFATGGAVVAGQYLEKRMYILLAR